MILQNLDKTINLKLVDTFLAYIQFLGKLSTLQKLFISLKYQLDIFIVLF